jgi:hypothetical protein
MLLAGRQQGVGRGSLDAAHSADAPLRGGADNPVVFFALR